MSPSQLNIENEVKSNLVLWPWRCWPNLGAIAEAPIQEDCGTKELRGKRGIEVNMKATKNEEVSSASYVHPEPAKLECLAKKVLPAGPKTH